MYKIIFEDNSEFLGGDFENSRWKEIPNKPIKKIEYPLINKLVILENFQAYNHLIEKIQSIDGRKYITKIFLIGKKDNEVTIIQCDFLKKDLTTYKKLFGKEYYGKSTIGWKLGLEGKNPIIII